LADQARIDRKRFADDKLSRHAHGHHALRQSPKSIAVTEALMPDPAEILQHCSRRYKKS
jgi:hypothetical protein